MAEGLVLHSFPTHLSATLLPLLQGLFVQYSLSGQFDQLLMFQHQVVDVQMKTGFCTGLRTLYWMQLMLNAWYNNSMVVCVLQKM